MGKVSESIFSNGDAVIPMADVQHIEKQSLSGEPNGIMVITKHTKWNFKNDCWENGIYISKIDKKDEKFLSAWCYYRSELESETLMDLTE